jgi:hypothetical protein
MWTPLDLRVALPAQNISSPVEKRLILACMGFMALRALSLRHRFMGTRSLKDTLVMTEKAELSGQGQKEFRVIRLVHLVARITSADTHRRVNRRTVKTLGVVARVTQVRSGKVQKLRLI